MVGHGKETTDQNHKSKMATLKMANVHPLSIEKCIKKLYGDEKISNIENYDKKNAICVHWDGKSYFSLCNRQLKIN